MLAGGATVVVGWLIMKATKVKIKNWEEKIE